MLRSRLSLTRGPPGTGKSTTAAKGIASLYLKEGGLIVVTAPSNFACDVLYDALRKVNNKYRVKMNIVRIVSESRERLWLKTKKSDSNEGTHILNKYSCNFI